jgi:hypothetical protein
MKSLRAWATPLTIATTLVTLVTGVFLFFHYAPGLTRPSHEWIGMLMVGAVAAHMLLNWRAFTTYFKRPAELALMVLGAVAMVATILVSAPDNAHGPSGMRTFVQMLGDARVETLAELAGQETATVLARLGAAGIEAEATATLSALTSGDRAKQDDILALIVAR